MKLKMVLYSLLLVISIILFAKPSVYAAINDRPSFIAKFEILDHSTNKGERYSTYTNENGALAWCESYLLEAYLDMYEATNNTTYLERFIRQADRVIGNTDLKRGVADYKGRSVSGWAATKYSKNGERVVWLAHSGMITYPMIRFAWVVNKNKLNSYNKQAKSYIEVTKSAMAFFDRGWIYDKVTGKGYYQFDTDEPHSGNIPNPPMPLPFNMQLAAGRSFIMLFLVTGEQAYFQKASGLAKHFKSYLNLEFDGSFTWNYWYGKGYERYKAIEDISHGAIDVDFAILAYRAGVVFTQEDMMMFLKTFTKKITKKGTFADKVDGAGSNTYKNQIGRWLELSEFNCAPWEEFKTLSADGKILGEPEVMLGVAKLIKYQNKCGK